MSVESSKKYEFKAEVKQLLNILVHSLYTSREIFLRELISNASDALDKVRFEMTRGGDVVDKELPLEIKISFDEKKKMITISDTGIGMNKDELINNIGTIAKSGSAEFLKQIVDSKADANNIIGKFGVGFYSVFMVADEVKIKSRSYRADEPGVEWRSDGLGEYEIGVLDKDIKRGTVIEIHLKEEAKEFADKWRLESTIKKHSNFIQFPIYLENEKVNTTKALWREPKSSIKEEEYNEFYKTLSYDTEEPMDIIHKSVDAPIQFNTLLFIPKKQDQFFWQSRENYGLNLYVRRVLIQHQNKELLPEYLSFVKGVVDSEDLPLNISRETLQENVVFNKIAQSVTSQILSHLQKKAKETSDKYNEFWKEHGRVFKLGYMDFANHEKFMELLRFNSSFNEDEKGLTSFEDYSMRMKGDQKEIYYAVGSSRGAIALDPHLEIFKGKGVEVLYLYDPIDEFVINSIRKYKDYDLKNVESIDLKKIEKLPDVTEKKEKPEKLDKSDEKHFDSLLAAMKKHLGDKITDVKESKRLSESAACLVGEDELSSQMHKIMRMTNQEFGPQKKVMEINKDHKLIRNLLAVFKSDSSDKYIEDVTNQLFESALLLEDSLSDPHTLVNRINKLLEQSSDWYREVKKI
jgi:molecular chaperone HtpG